jgi:hypothetical protein
MARYLLVAHQTALSDELLSSARSLAGEDPEAAFVILVPATPVGTLLVWEEGATADVAARRGAAARAWLQEHGLQVADVRTGDQDPVAAIGDEMHAGHQYAAIVISTLPAGISRWVRMDVLSRVRRNYPGQRVIHIAAAAPASSRPR